MIQGLNGSTPGRTDVSFTRVINWGILALGSAGAVDRPDAWCPA